MRVETLAVGTELLLGDIVNGNAAWLGQRLAANGLDVVAGAVVGDNIERIADAIRLALSRSDALLITGGLGPTQDDVTREALALVAGVGMRRDEQIVASLYERAGRLGRDLPERNLRQADVPEGATPLLNTKGTAPGLRVELPDGVVYALPGVPFEMETMVLEQVLPDLAARAGLPSSIVSRTLRTIGLWESAVAELLAGLDTRLGATHASDPTTPTLAYLAGGGEVRVRITAKASSTEEAQARIAPVEAEVRGLLGPAVYGADHDSIDRVVHRLLRERGETVAVAESLTGGLLGARLTRMPGASETFRGGVVAYATDVKADLLGVPADLLEAHGAVSGPTAAALAEGARRSVGATYALALTGVAGPEPDEGKPPGLVYVGMATPTTTLVRELKLPGDRERIRELAVTASLDLLRRYLLGVLPETAEEPA
ncbi:MAG: nicotinamide-nucleotide amidase [Frankiales bacterium]|nr:nicotinamide-nucleotide amidase [Frankiales bacterium]